MSHLFKKKPVVIEAFQMTRERRADNADWPRWLGEAWNRNEGEPGRLFPTIKEDCTSTLSISTLEGDHIVSWGDWIILGIIGDIYPCKPNVFEATYEQVEE
jgi:hypothetical protein